jgi:hypothetical protein
MGEEQNNGGFKNGNPDNRNLQFDPSGKNTPQADNSRCLHPEGGKNKICTQCIEDRTALRLAKKQDREAIAARALEYDLQEEERYRQQKKYEKADRDAFYARENIRQNEVKSICFANPDIEILGAEVCKDHVNFTGLLKIDYVREIFDSAFENLGQVFIDKFEESSVTKLHGSVFRNSGLTGNIELPSTLVLLGNECFLGTKLKEVTISHAIAEQGDNIFRSNQLLTKLTLNDGVVQIGDGMFYECKRLGPELNFPASITNLGELAFRNCIKLEKVSFLGNDNLVIGSSAFLRCSSLKELSFGSGVKEIGSYSFNGSKIQGNLHIPDSCSSIGSNAFLYSIDGAEVTFPTSPFDVGEQAFRGAKITNNLSLGAVTNVGASAFQSIDYPDDIANIDLSGNVLNKSIRPSAFRNLPQKEANISVNFSPSSWIGTGHLKPKGITGKYKRGDDQSSRKVKVNFTSGLLADTYAGEHFFSPVSEEINGTTYYSTTHYRSDEQYIEGFDYGYIKYIEIGNMWEVYWDGGVGQGEGYYSAYSSPVHPQDAVYTPVSFYASHPQWVEEQEYGNDPFEVINYKGVNYNVDGGVLPIGTPPVNGSGDLHPSVSLWEPQVGIGVDDIGGEAVITIRAVENGVKGHNLSASVSGYADFPDSAIFRDKTSFCGEINLNTSDIDI